MTIFILMKFLFLVRNIPLTHEELKVISFHRNYKQTSTGFPEVTEVTDISLIPRHY